jgi:hypothetical protein
MIIIISPPLLGVLPCPLWRQRPLTNIITKRGREIRDEGQGAGRKGGEGLVEVLMRLNYATYFFSPVPQLTSYTISFSFLIAASLTQHYKIVGRVREEARSKA